MKRIIIIGAGYCGTAAASLLLRSDVGFPLEIVLLNRSGLLGRGMAYGTRSDDHLLNVPAARMDALASDAGGFLRYARELDASVEPASFVSRKWFGDYLESVLIASAREACNGNLLTCVVGNAIDIQPVDGGKRVQVHLDQGTVLGADRAILTLGNFAPADPEVPSDHRAFYFGPRYVRDPWRPDALSAVKPDQPVLLVGSGLTMLDVLLDLRAHGLRAPVHAISRRGLSPLPHRELEVSPVYDHTLPDNLLSHPNVLQWLKLIRTEADRAIAAGNDWRDVIGSLRSATPTLWRALPLNERERFLRHLRPYWEIHRHRCAPAVAARLVAELNNATLHLTTGRLLGFEESADSVNVSFRRRGQKEIEHLSFGAVINCTGPESNTQTTSDSLISALRTTGRIKPDELGLGLEVSKSYELISKAGDNLMPLFYAGPFLRADYWEATAIPELKVHTAQMVAAVLANLRPTAG